MDTATFNGHINMMEEGDSDAARGAWGELTARGIALNPKQRSRLAVAVKNGNKRFDQNSPESWGSGASLADENS